MKRRSPERDFHKQAAAYLRAVLPEDAFWTTFPAGGGGRIRGAQLKAMGLQAGVPDLFILYRGDAIFIELKAPKGVVSEAQKFISGKIIEAGGFSFVCYSDLQYLEMCLLGMGIPLTGKLAA